MYFRGGAATLQEKKQGIILDDNCRKNRKFNCMPNIELTLAQLLGFSLTSGIVTFILNSLYSSWSGRKLRVIEERHAALKIALSLEKFSIGCSAAISDHLTFLASEQSNGKTFSTLPTLSLPNEIEWKLLDNKITNHVLAFENTIQYANGDINWSINYYAPDEDNNTPELQAGYCGLEALLLAEKLRKRYSLPKRLPPTRTWNYEKLLKEWHEKMVRRL